jgi:hypothetical protein
VAKIEALRAQFAQIDQLRQKFVFFRTPRVRPFIKKKNEYRMLPGCCRPVIRGDRRMQVWIGFSRGRPISHRQCLEKEDGDEWRKQKAAICAVHHQSRAGTPKRKSNGSDNCCPNNTPNRQPER